MVFEEDIVLAVTLVSELGGQQSSLLSAGGDRQGAHAGWKNPQLHSAESGDILGRELILSMGGDLRLW